MKDIIDKFKEHIKYKQQNPTLNFEYENYIAQDINEMVKDLEDRIRMTKEKFITKFTI